MAQHSIHCSWSPSSVRSVMFLLGICLAGYVMGSSLYWNMTKRFPRAIPCHPCACNCSSESVVSVPLPIDCEERDPETTIEMGKTIADLTAEELKLRVQVNRDNQQHAEASAREIQKTTLHYRKEADKCNVGIQTCEEARERAEEALRDELKLSAIWEKRACDLGWSDT